MHKHYKLYKPYGYLSQFVNNQKQRKNKKLLGELHDFAEGTMAVGRLDEKSEGLLLLTTNGKLSEQISSNKVEKEYYVQVVGKIDDEKIQKLSEGVDIKLKSEIYTTKPAEVKRIDPNKILEMPAQSGREERQTARPDGTGPRGRARGKTPPPRRLRADGTSRPPTASDSWSGGGRDGRIDR